MRYEDVIQLIPCDQKVMYSVTLLKDSCRGQVIDSPIMTGHEARLERQVFEGCVTSIEADENVIRIYIRQYLSYSEL